MSHSYKLCQHLRLPASIIAIIAPCYALACGPSQSVNQLVDFGTITVPETAPINSVIASKASTPEFTTGTFSCGSNPVFRAELSSFTDAYDARNKIYRTDIPGVGIRIITATSGSPNRSFIYPYSRSLGSSLYHNRETFYVELIKIGDITRGDLAGKKLASANLRTTESFRLYVGTGEIIGKVPTCDLNVTDQTLPTIRIGDFGPDRVAGIKNFSISASCRNATSVDFTFSGTPDPADPYRFKNSGTAAGVGLWLRSTADGATIRANGTDSTRTAAVISDRATLALAASYWRIGATPTHGSLTSNVTVNITYR